MTYQEQYQKKLVTAKEAVSMIESGMWIDYGFCTGMARTLDRALALRMEEEQDLCRLNIRSGISLWDLEVTKVTNAKERINWNSWHSSAVDRKIFSKGFGYYGVIRYSELPRYYRENIKHTDVLMIQTAPMDEEGYFNFGPNASHLSAAVEIADRVIIEINQNMPVCLGEKEVAVHIDQVDMIVEEGDSYLAEVPGAPVTAVDEAIARLILPEIPDGACLQLGIGGMPNVMGKLIAQSDLKDLGIHSEVYVDSMMEMTKAGKITGLQKQVDPGKQVYTFAMGSRELYQFIDRNPDLMQAPVDYVNDLRRISAIDNFMSINNALEVDLFGQVAAEAVGFRHVSGAGGQMDFVVGSYLSKGGKSFICLSSTVTDREGNRKSRLLPHHSPGSIVTCTRANTQYLVTEYGIVNLKGATTWQRAEKIISIAHPDFRDELIRGAEEMGVWCPSNKR